MKTVTRIVCLAVGFIFISPGEHHSGVAGYSAKRPFDEYTNICWNDEKARLDNFAIHLQQEPKSKGFIVVYAGRVSCAGEAKYRAERAKKWIVKRGVEAERIILRDGGYSEEVITILHLMPEGHEFPIDYTKIDPSEVLVSKDCNGKIYAPVRCDVP